MHTYSWCSACRTGQYCSYKSPGSLKTAYGCQCPGAGPSTRSAHQLLQSIRQCSVTAMCYPKSVFQVASVSEYIRYKFKTEWLICQTLIQYSMDTQCEFTTTRTYNMKLNITRTYRLFHRLSFQAHRSIQCFPADFGAPNKIPQNVFPQSGSIVMDCWQRVWRNIFLLLSMSLESLPIRVSSLEFSHQSVPRSSSTARKEIHKLFFIGKCLRSPVFQFIAHQACPYSGSYFWQSVFLDWCRIPHNTTQIFNHMDNSFLPFIHPRQLFM